MSPASAPTASTISIRETLELLDGDFASLADGIAKRQYAVWLGSGISRGRVDDLKRIVDRVLTYLRERIDRTNTNCAYHRSLNEAIGYANLSPTECFYRTERYDVGMQVAKLMIDERAPSDCFENNGLLCGLLSDSNDEKLVKRAIEKLRNPFISHNVDILMQAPAQLKSLALFENYRFGLSTRKQNTLTITVDGRVRELKAPVITIGRLEENEICLADTNVSRRHCALVNYLDDVWVYDLGSTQGVFVDGKRIERKAYIEAQHPSVASAEDRGQPVSRPQCAALSAAHKVARLPPLPLYWLRRSVVRLPLGLERR